METAGREQLASYAMRASASRGRRHHEDEHPFRSPYQRDRDRIIHAAAFRALEYKTQVFLNHEGDYYRTRLTHTLEVFQLSRTLARSLALNEDLTEAVALAHDLGHTPFGHAGEDELDDCMRDHGGFEHNAHGLRVVDVLEHKYAAFEGLNLTYEVRQAFIDHHTPYDHPGRPPEFAPEGRLLEVEVTLVADEIAYLNHDIDDGLAAGILRGEDLEAIPLWREAVAEAADAAGTKWGGLSPALKRAEGVRRLINRLMSDVAQTTAVRLAERGVTSLAAVRAPRDDMLVGLSPALAAGQKELQDFLYARFYRHHRVMRSTLKARRFLRELFEAFVARPRHLLPEEQAARIAADGLPPERVVCDYLAGLTDRFALKEYRQVFLPDPE